MTQDEIVAIVSGWPTSTLILAQSVQAAVLLNPYGSHQAFFIEWPDGKGGRVRFTKYDLWAMLTAAEKELDRRFPFPTPKPEGA